MTFALGPLDHAALPRWPIVWLARRDVEARWDTGPTTGDDVVRIDWLDGEAQGLHRLTKGLRHRLGHWSRGLPGIARRLVGIHDRLAEGRLRRGCALLWTGRVVITDRLHGHILSMLLGIPHVLLDSRYGKVRAFHDTWTRATVLTRFASSPDDALRLARALVGGGGRGDR